jgi:hypothetical protein
MLGTTAIIAVDGTVEAEEGAVVVGFFEDKEASETMSLASCPSDLASVVDDAIEALGETGGDTDRLVSCTSEVGKGAEVASTTSNTDSLLSPDETGTVRGEEESGAVVEAGEEAV